MEKALDLHKLPFQTLVRLFGLKLGNSGGGGFGALAESIVRRQEGDSVGVTISGVESRQYPGKNVVRFGNRGE